MPEMNGIETLLEMKKGNWGLNENTPVVMLTANAVAGAREEYLKYGFWDYLTKPIQYDKLKEVILRYFPDDVVNTVPSAPLENMPQNDSSTEDILGDSRYEQLEEKYTERNWKEYLDEVNIIRSKAKGIGAESFMTELEVLENAVNSGETTAIREQHFKVMYQYKELLSKLRVTGK